MQTNPEIYALPRWSSSALIGISGTCHTWLIPTSDATQSILYDRHTETQSMSARTNPSSRQIIQGMRRIKVIYEATIKDIQLPQPFTILEKRAIQESRDGKNQKRLDGNLMDRFGVYVLTRSSKGNSSFSHMELLLLVLWRAPQMASTSCTIQKAASSTEPSKFPVG